MSRIHWTIKLDNQQDRVILPVNFMGTDTGTTHVDHKTVIARCRSAGWYLREIDTSQPGVVFLRYRKGES